MSRPVTSAYPPTPLARYRSYSYAEVLLFKDRAAHDRYQVHPTHRHFVDRCANFWKRVVIYDSLG
jgi:Stress responsive A/B Barrel Domain